MPKEKKRSRSRSKSRENNRSRSNSTENTKKNKEEQIVQVDKENNEEIKKKVKTNNEQNENANMFSENSSNNQLQLSNQQSNILEQQSKEIQTQKNNNEKIESESDDNQSDDEKVAEFEGLNLNYQREKDADNYEKWYDEYQILRDAHDTLVKEQKLMKILLFPTEEFDEADSTSIVIDTSEGEERVLNSILFEMKNVKHADEFDSINTDHKERKIDDLTKALASEWIEWRNVIELTHELLDPKYSGKIENSFLIDVEGGWNSFSSYLDTQMKEGHTKKYYSIENTKENMNKMLKQIQQIQKEGTVIDKNIFNSNSKTTLLKRPDNPFL